MTRPVRLLASRQGALGGYADALEAAAARALQAAGRRAGLGPAHELSLLLCDNATMRRLNRRWRGIDRATDVLSFPAAQIALDTPPPPGPLGDIVIALPVARRQAREAGEPDARRVERLAIHGLAHLLGHDHNDDGEERRMLDCEELLLGRPL